MIAGNTDLDRRFFELMQDEFTEEELWAISFLLDLFATTGRARITTTYERLADIMGISVRTLRNYLAAFERIPWLTVIRARPGLVLLLQDAAFGGNMRQYAATEVDDESTGDTAGNSRQNAASCGNRRQYAAAGGDIGGAGGQVYSPDPLLAYLLVGERFAVWKGVSVSHPPARPDLLPVDAAKCREMPPDAAKCLEMPALETDDGDAAKCHKMPQNAANFPDGCRATPDAAKRPEMPSSAAKCREMPADGAEYDVDVDEDVLDRLLEAVGEAFLLSEAEAREILAAATTRGLAPGAGADASAGGDTSTRGAGRGEGAPDVRCASPGPLGDGHGGLPDAALAGALAGRAGAAGSGPAGPG